MLHQCGDHRLEDRLFEPGLTDRCGKRKPFMSAAGDAGEQSFLAISGGKCLQKALHGILLLARQRKCVKHHGAANRDDRRELAQDGAISGEKQEWFGGAELREGRSSRLEFRHATQSDFGNRL